MPNHASLGPRIRALRARSKLTQAALAKRLGISASYLNLLENGKRKLSAEHLLRLAEEFEVDLQSFAGDSDASLDADLQEVFGDPVFASVEVPDAERRDLAVQAPAVARAILALHRAYEAALESARSLAEHVTDAADPSIAPSGQLSSEEVSDFIQTHGNHFEELEESAERLWSEGDLDPTNLRSSLVRFLEDRLGIRVRIVAVDRAGGAVRRFDPAAKELTLSELLAPRSRIFQLAHQIGLMTQGAVLDRLTAAATLTTADSRALCRVALANYFAGAVLMPYGRFRKAALDYRYDVELLGNRFRTSFEQVCHRLTSLRRRGAEGVPFHMIRIDIAGNISKRFTASGIRFARFSGACPRWNVHSAFLTPGIVRTQLSRMPDGTTFFCFARTISKGSGGYHAPHTVQAIGMGCEVSHARDLVYADGVDLQNLDAAVPIGVTCRLCDRMDCEQRAFPPIQHPLRVDENVRGVSFYAPAATSRERVLPGGRAAEARTTTVKRGPKRRRRP